ncbi:small ribosomal subunit protein uS15m [Tribolium castaneum]|uniref:Small ribosomal subunit protein uS15m n=1 Tax=Tribolium castaneum TaxID=7070 RepID=D6WMI0_TRICA|nr:PREDICTED: 28S ribosomal protein S15, mitochondrial [Tribolium castaneum]EFA03294.1 28S ribosomal protein S15, mitochondrial-like Protein [Tribolium castaneum]|eukprot:XP_968136.1 PREDICTED: 28S ribosomal protein S15, mitochondrial [Tribolium castaneum]
MNVLTSVRLGALTLKSARTYAFKSDLKIKWVRPEKIPCIKPEKSGDLEAMMKIDLSQPQLPFRGSKELETADETVKKLFSLEYAPRRKLTQVYGYEMKQLVKRHEFDTGSVEVQIARWTAIIRAYQDLMEKFPRNKVMKVVLKEMIDRRKKKLKYLRRWDYKRFEWLLEALKIVYKPPPDHFHWITRKESLRKLTNNYCEDIRQRRLDEYKQLLQNEQPVFLQEKIRALEFIRNEQRECGVEVTVTDEEVEAVRKQLKELEEQRKSEEE